MEIWNLGEWLDTWFYARGNIPTLIAIVCRSFCLSSEILGSNRALIRYRRMMLYLLSSFSGNT